MMMRRQSHHHPKKGNNNNNNNTFVVVVATLKAGMTTTTTTTTSSSRREKRREEEEETRRLLLALNAKRGRFGRRHNQLYDSTLEEEKDKMYLLRLYKKVLEQSKRFADPALRHYGYHRIGEQFRRHKDELGKEKKRLWKKEARKQSRRMERALRGDRDDYRHFLELAYGVKGRVGHAMRRFEEEKKVEKKRRQEKFMLKPIDEETMETFSVKSFLRMVEDASLRDGAKFEEQMDVLKRKVPTYFGIERRSKRKDRLDDSNKNNHDENDENDDVFAYEDARTRWRETEDAIDALEEEGAKDAEPKERRRSFRLEHWHVHDDTMFEKYPPNRLSHGYDINWESNHVALLKSVFEPTLIARLDRMPRKWFRTYRRTLFEDIDYTNKRKEDISRHRISSDMLKDVQRTAPLKILVKKADSDDDVNDDDALCENDFGEKTTTTRASDPASSSSSSSSSSGKTTTVIEGERSAGRGGIKLAESELFVDDDDDPRAAAAAARW